MIETARLRLRRGMTTDIPGLVAALNDWDVAQRLQWPPFPYSADEARAFLRWSRADDDTAPPVAYVVAERASDRLLGVASLGRAQMVRSSATGSPRRRKGAVR